MDKYSFENLKSNHFLADYEPEETRYARFSDQPWILAVGHKIVDVYNIHCRARGMLYYSYSKDWGDISATDDKSILFSKSQMIIAAILEYSICLDIIWQVIWAGFQPTSLQYLLRGKYKELESLCTSSTVHELLNCAMGTHGIGEDLAKSIKSLLVEFENQPAVIKIRKLNNMIKHHGTIHIEGLGENRNYLNYTVDDFEIPRLSRESYKIEEIEILLLEYDELLVEFIMKLADLLLPENYKETKCSLGDLILSSLEMKKFL